MSETCQECGMTVDSNEYHPYAACLMFKGCQNSQTVRANVDGLMAHALEYHNDDADRLAAIETRIQNLINRKELRAKTLLEEGEGDHCDGYCAALDDEVNDLRAILDPEGT